MSFHVPTGWEQYHHQIKKCYDVLLDARILDDISPTRFSSWFANFSNAEEKYLAAHLLDSLVYRTQPMLVATCNHVLDKVLPHLLMREGVLINSIQEFREKLKSDPGALPIRFATVTSDVPGKSGENLWRLFRRHARVHANYGIYIKDVLNAGDAVEYIFLLDDIAGTGRQFSDFVVSSELARLCEESNVKIFYIPFMAHEKGIKKIKKDCPNINLFPVEVLSSSRHNFFRPCPDDCNLWARDKRNSVKDVKEFYRKLVQGKGISTGKVFGYGQLGLTVYSGISSPNNSLDIFYSDRSKSWASLFDR